MLLFLLQCCCGRWHHRQNHIKRKSLHERLFGSDSIRDQRYIYTINNLHIPIDSLSLYDMSENNSFYSSKRSYIPTRNNIPFYADETTNNFIEDTIKKNYIINETQNYYIQQRLFYDEDYIKHNQKIQILPGPTITIINMAAERITDEPNWEEAYPFEIQYNKHYNLSSNPKNNQLSSLEKYIKYDQQPIIYNRFESNFSRISSLNSITSEISGYDSESIYETIRVFSPSNQSSISLRNEDEYKTANIDEIDIRIKDLLYLSKNK